MRKGLYENLAERWCETGSVWLYSDPHFSDVESYRFRGLLDDSDIVDERKLARIVRSLDEMQIRNINRKVTNNDTLIILGDVGNVECVKELRGYKVLVMGNHDKGASNYRREVKVTFDSTHMTEEDSALMKRGIDTDEVIRKYLKTVDNRLFDEVYEGPIMVNDRLMLSHEPIELPEFMFDIHGHVHSKQIESGNSMNVCAELMDYTPVNLCSMIECGLLKDVTNVHRRTIDNAISRKGKRK